jgi:hypothetical protein
MCVNEKKGYCKSNRMSLQESTIKLENKNHVKLSLLALKLFMKLESTYPLHTKKDTKKTRKNMHFSRLDVF